MFTDMVFFKSSLGCSRPVHQEPIVLGCAQPAVADTVVSAAFSMLCVCPHEQRPWMHGLLWPVQLCMPCLVSIVNSQRPFELPFHRVFRHVH